MTFHQEIGAPNPNRSDQFRLKALLSERRSGIDRPKVEDGLGKIGHTGVLTRRKRS